MFGCQQWSGELEAGRKKRKSKLLAENTLRVEYGYAWVFPADGDGEFLQLGVDGQFVGVVVAEGTIHRHQVHLV